MSSPFDPTLEESAWHDQTHRFIPTLFKQFVSKPPEGYFNFYYMKNIAVLILMLGLYGCSEDIPSPGKIPDSCSTLATVRDLSGLDGCGFVFELSDGTRLEPAIVFYCGTPPLPKEVTLNPLYDFDLVDGKRVRISYTPAAAGSVCMAGTPVTITCISEVTTVSPGEF